MNAISDKYVNKLSVDGETYSVSDLQKFAKDNEFDLNKLPYTIRILLENVMRQVISGAIEPKELQKFTSTDREDREIPFLPARVLMQDFTGVPAVVDFAALRDAMQEKGADPSLVDPLVRGDLIIDHSIQVDKYGTADACSFNQKKEYERNSERYQLLRWGQSAFDNLQIVPPGQGIIHQVNLEYLASLVYESEQNGEKMLYPDTVLGTDSHTTMINGLGVLGWGVGGIEAEAVMVGEPFYMLIPPVVGVRLTGEPGADITATDIVLKLTQRLRAHGVVGKFVEYFGPGLRGLSLPDRAVISNMTPEYGATAGYFPVDEESIAFLETTGRSPATVSKAREYYSQQGLTYDPEAPAPDYDEQIDFDISSVEPAVAGPTLPHQHISLSDIPDSFTETVEREKQGVYSLELQGEEYKIEDGALLIAALSSCTNTSSPELMIAAGLLAKKAVEAGLKVPPHVKTSLAPGSRVVTGYLEDLELLEPLSQLNFDLVGYGCSSCIGNSGPLAPELVHLIEEEGLFATSVICGNRNFEGRISPHTKANYLASPPLVVAFALAGRINIDFETEPLGEGQDGTPVYLKDLWPDQSELSSVAADVLKPELFESEYEGVFAGDELWRSLDAPSGDVFQWQDDSTYIKKPPFVEQVSAEIEPPDDILEARCLCRLSDSVTTDHISPAGDIPKNSPAADYLRERGVETHEFNTYGSRRGNHEVMMRGTFGNIRLDNELVEKEGGYTVHWPSGEETTIYDAAMRYQREGTPLVVLAGKQYGTGSSRDWAAKGTELLGVRAVIAESYERIHRSNLVGMGVLPLQFKEGEDRNSLGLSGREAFSIKGLNELSPGGLLTVQAKTDEGDKLEFEVLNRLDTEVELNYFKNGGILPYVLRDFLTSNE